MEVSDAMVDAAMDGWFSNTVDWRTYRSSTVGTWVADMRRALEAALAAQQSTPAAPTPQGRTVDVRVAVAVDGDGTWRAFGYSECTETECMNEAVEDLVDGEARYWINATLALPVPTVAEVAARVEDAG